MILLVVLILLHIFINSITQPISYVLQGNLDNDALSINFNIEWSNDNTIPSYNYSTIFSISYSIGKLLNKLLTAKEAQNDILYLFTLIKPGNGNESQLPKKNY